MKNRLIIFVASALLILPVLASCSRPTVTSTPNQLLTLDTANWMRDSWDLIKTSEIWNIVLPGTHDSGTFSWWNTSGVRDQDLDIKGQLEGGIRKFDIRVTSTQTWLGGTIYLMHHSGLFPFILVDQSQFLETALQQMKDFASTHPNEIFIISLSPGYGSNLDNRPDLWEPVRQMVVKYLGMYLVPWGTQYYYSLENIHAMNGNVILLSDMGKITGIEEYFWNTGVDFIRDTWDGHQDDFNFTIDDRFNWMCEHIKQELRTPPLRFFNAACNSWDVSTFQVAENNNPRFAQYISSKLPSDPQLRQAMNIFSFDFFEVGGVVQTIVELNCNYSFGVFERPLLQTSPSVLGKADLEKELNKAYASNKKVFSEANIKASFSALGLNWDKYKQEYEKTGSLGEASLDELEGKNIPRFLMPEFLKWSADKIY